MTLKFQATSLIIIALSCGCAKSIITDDETRSRYEPSGRTAVKSMIDSLSAINRNSPVSYSADLYVDGISNGKKFKIKGNAQFDRTRKMMYIAFKDYIFNSPAAFFFKEGESVRILVPIEKKLYTDSSKTINLANYGGAGLDYGVLFDITTGTIPLPRNYAIRQGLTAKQGPGSLLVLENEEYIETISFMDGIPDKILFINKNTRDRLEIYIKKSMQQGESRFFSGLKILSGHGSLTLEVYFSNIALGVPVKVKTINDIKLPEPLQIIKM